VRLFGFLCVDDLIINTKGSKGNTKDHNGEKDVNDFPRTSILTDLNYIIK
jgi:hypothetical protein